VTIDYVRIVLARKYLDIYQHLGDILLKIDAIIQHARSEVLIIAMDNK